MNEISAAALDAVSLINHVAVLGKTGSGKSSTAKALLERVVMDYTWMARRDARVCILDPIKSDWWGITLAPDGRRPGMPFVIIGGPHGHVPLHKEAGGAIGDPLAGGTEGG